MANVRVYNFTTGVTTGTQPDAGTPSVSADLVTLGYLQSALGAVVINSRASPGAIVAGTGITYTAGYGKMKIYIQGSGGAVTVTANPRVQAGTIDGQEILLVGRSDSNTVTLATGNGLVLNGSCTLGADQTLSLSWDGTNFVETGRSH